MPPQEVTATGTDLTPVETGIGTLGNAIVRALIGTDAPESVRSALYALLDKTLTVHVDNPSGAITFPTTQQVSGSVAVSNFPATQPVSGTVGIAGTVPVSGTVGISGPGEISNDAGNAIPVSGTVTALPSGTQAVSGTVNVGNFPATQPVSGSVAVSNLPATQTVGGTVAVSNFPATQPVSGTVAISGTVPVSGTVTAAPSRGALTDRSGTITTASTSQTTPAVSNAARTYLRVHNPDTTNDLYVNYGAAAGPAAVGSSRLVPGGSDTYEGSSIPTDAVFVYSTKAGALFTIKER